MSLADENESLIRRIYREIDAGNIDATLLSQLGDIQLPPSTQ
jgi:hypothetical protein